MNYYYIIVFLIGMITALAELISRYNKFGQIFKFWSSWFYFAINGSASMLAYWFISKYNLDFGTLTETEIGKILIAGTSSMVILRSSVASIKSGGKNIEAGFASITNVFLNQADREFDQKRSIDDYKRIKVIMKDVDFEKAKKDLPLTCLSMMKNVPAEEQKLLADDLIKLANEQCSNKAKSINLGVVIARTTGIELLEEVVTSFMDTISSKSSNIAEEIRFNKLNDLLKKFK